MKAILVLSLIFLLQLSIVIHVIYMVGYISSKSNKDFRGFIITSFTNILCGMVLTIVVFMNPKVVRKLNIDFLLLLEAGFVFLALLILKIRISLRALKRSRDPANFHLSYFGKKVYDGPLVSKNELAFYFLSMPVTLISGAYFVVKVFF